MFMHQKKVTFLLQKCRCFLIYGSLRADITATNGCIVKVMKFFGRFFFFQVHAD